MVPTYLRLLAWPAGQNVDWFVPPGGLDVATLAGAAALAALVAAATWGATRLRGRPGDLAAAGRVASLGALFFLLVLVPTSTVVPLRDVLVEHRVYLASLGVSLAAAALGTAAVRRAAGSRTTLAGGALAVAALLALGLATARRSAVWASPLALWSDAAAKAPEKARVHLGLAYALLGASRPADALVSLRRARARADDLTVSQDTLLDVTVSTLLAVGRFDEARAEIEGTLAAYPVIPRRSRRSRTWRS